MRLAMSCCLAIRVCCRIFVVSGFGNMREIEYAIQSMVTGATGLGLVDDDAGGHAFGECREMRDDTDEALAVLAEDFEGGGDVVKGLVVEVREAFVDEEALERAAGGVAGEAGELLGEGEG